MSKKVKRTKPETDKRRIIRKICAEFGVAPQDLLERGRGRENFLRLMALCLAVEDRRKKAGREAVLARRRLRKYLKFVPGLRRAYEKLRAGIREKARGF